MFIGSHFPSEVIIETIRYYLAYKLSYREIEDIKIRAWIGCGYWRFLNTKASLVNHSGGRVSTNAAQRPVLRHDEHKTLVRKRAAFMNR